MSDANVSLELPYTTGCTGASDLRHLQDEVNSSQWAQAAYYTAAVGADIAANESSFDSFLAQYPAQKQNFPGPYPWATLKTDVHQLAALLPRVAASVQGSC